MEETNQYFNEKLYFLQAIAYLVVTFSSVSQSVSHVFSNQLVQHISSFLLDLPKLFQYSSGWSHTIPSSPIQFLNVPYSPLWSHIILYGPIQSHIVPYKSLRSQTVHEVPTVNQVPYSLLRSHTLPYSSYTSSRSQSPLRSQEIPYSLIKSYTDSFSVSYSNLLVIKYLMSTSLQM